MRVFYKREHLRQRSLHWLFACAVWLAAFFPSQLPAQPPTPEYRTEAAFLYQFTHFIEWPATWLTPNDKAFVICVAGGSLVHKSLEQMSRDKAIGPHPVRVRQVRANDDVRPCHVLFIPASESARTQHYLDQVRGVAVLTVSDEPGFCLRGGVVEFRVEAERVHFDISVSAAERSGLHASSRLLRLIRHPEDQPHAGGSR